MPQQSSSSESELITTLLSKNHSLLAEKRNDKMSLIKVNDSHNRRLTAAKALNDTNVIDLDISDNSNELNNEMFTELLPLPINSSSSTQVSTQVSTNGANDKGIDNSKNDSKVVNGSLPLIIIPSNNQMIGNPFSGKTFI